MKKKVKRFGLSKTQQHDVMMEIDTMLGRFVRGDSARECRFSLKQIERAFSQYVRETKEDIAAAHRAGDFK